MQDKRPTARNIPKNLLEKFIDKWNDKTTDYDNVYGHQCTDLIKQYTKDVMWLVTWTFWWSAATWWINKSNTFDPNVWRKVKNNYADPNQTPQPGDIIFFDWPTKYDHVAIVVSAFPGENTIKVFEQNTGNGDGQWYDDRCRVSFYDYSTVHWWYTPLKFAVQIMQVPVIHKPLIEKRPTLLGSYNPFRWYISIYPRALTKSPRDYYILLCHEFSHKVYWADFSYKDVLLWESVSRQDPKILNHIKKYLPATYWVNKYISPGETNESEDFAETWEDYMKNGKILKEDSVRGWYTRIKQNACIYLMQKYWYTKEQFQKELDIRLVYE